MTLKDWKNLTGIKPTHPTTEMGAMGAISLCISPGTPTRNLLWNLEDYNVSSVSGPVIWLTPKTVRKN